MRTSAWKMASAVLWLVLGCEAGALEARSDGGAEDDAAVALASSAARPPVGIDGRPWETPVVLLHGAFGWGRDELLGFKHFGGFRDLQEELNGAGYRTVSVAVGPLSSNWDRAAEMYAQLVGGTVDYGVAHSLEHGHDRFGRTYPGLLPGVGERDAAGRVRKVDIIAHSQGAQTARVLIALLAEGSAAERAACPGGGCGAGEPPLSPLFAGDGAQWVHGLATLSGAGDGSTLAHALQNEVNVNSLVASLAALVNAAGASGVYDFKLDHFGLGARRPGEPMTDYVERITHTMLDQNSRDTALYDLSIDGAAELNRWARAQPDVYYVTWTNRSSLTLLPGGKHTPMLETNLFLMPFTTFMGNYEPRGVIAQPWWENDGIVNTQSMDGPSLASTDRIVRYSGRIQPGVWQVMESRRGWDHWDMIGLLDLNHSFNQVRSMYVRAIDTLRSAP